MTDRKIDAEISRLRAYAIRIGPVVRLALELRELGRALESLEALQDVGPENPHETRCITHWLMTKQAYDTALSQFDEAVKAAALKQFADLWEKPRDG